MADKIKVNWEAYDGYVGRSRPQSFTLQLDDLGDGGEQSARDSLYEIMDEELRARVAWHLKNEEEIMEAWRNRHADNG